MFKYIESNLTTKAYISISFTQNKNRNTRLHLYLKNRFFLFLQLRDEKGENVILESS